MTGSVDLERARALFDDDALRWIVDRLQARLEYGRPLDARLRLAAPTDAQREALLRLTGKRPAGPRMPRGQPASTSRADQSRAAQPDGSTHRQGSSPRSISIDASELTVILSRAGIAPDLRALVEALRGPIRDRKAARAAEGARWAAAHRGLRRDAAALDPRLAQWSDDLEETGLLRRLAVDPEAANQLTEHALAVLRRLPADGVPLTQLAATALADSHALDDGRPLATLVLRALEHLTGLPRRDRGAAERRALWARAGVLLDELSAPALVLGLRAAGDGLLARTLRAHADAGEPCRVTLRQLVRHSPDGSTYAGAAIAICENPSVVSAAADRLGSRCPPLVCTEGQPSGAVQLLLGQLADAGAALHFHTDFDVGGLRIGNLLVDRFDALPWRMGRSDYEAAVRAGGTMGAPLKGSPDDASWDPELAAAIAARGRAVHEEQVMEVLLGDLEGWGVSPAPTPPPPATGSSPGPAAPRPGRTHPRR